MGSLSSLSFIHSLGLSLSRHSKLLLQGVSKLLRLLQKNFRSTGCGKHNTVRSKEETKLTFHSWSLLQLNIAGIKL